MKILYFTFLSSITANHLLDEIKCPGRCWEVTNDVCYPAENKVSFKLKQKQKILHLHFRSFWIAQKPEK